MKQIIMAVTVVALLGGVFIVNSMRDSSDPATEKSNADTDISPTQEVSQTPIPSPIKNKEKEPQKIYSPTPAKDTEEPKAYILEPKDNAVVTLGTDVKIVANVTDNVQVDRVEFYAGSNDYQHIGTVKQAPFEITWKVDSRFDGSINIPVYIKAFDTAGNQTSSAILVVAKGP